ncbi:hypothetical protein BC939DRAFT_99397 [Gamsiella multidivaricata]|uniref:uncharacterized protein n=1 Tax=Gamsiella multidivaricata TaxID=101098 RepID=UPI00221FE83E|nr:uncharacterized protein BC939DRAFT_99397 [Gamsiella multidivaricata]KAI7832246.1 hypothetical protein BC939DRAFT_99397 [Gamsiella multidivaricata]
MCAQHFYSNSHHYLLLSCLDMSFLLVSIGTLRNSRRENAPSRAMSAPSESEGAPQTTFQTNDSNMQTQSWLQSQMTDEPRMMVDEPMELPDGLQDSIMGMTSMDSNLFGDQASTFGLSDHDIMSSFTSFTAKLGDTLLARNDPAFGGVSEQDGSRMRLQFMGANGTTSVPSLSPTSMERSPTIASESLSPSPWMPWVSSDQSLMAETQKQQQAFGLQAGSQVSAEPQHVVLPMQSQSMYAGVHQTFLASTDSQMGEPQPMYTQGISTEAGKLPLQQQQMETWNQYMQYLLYQQEQGPLQQQYPHQFPQQAQVTQQTYQQSMDPHWQATMMTMMMDQNPTMERGVSPNAMSMPSGGSYQGAQPGP